MKTYNQKSNGKQGARHPLFRLRSIRSKLLISYLLIIILPCTLLGFGFIKLYDDMTARQKINDSQKDARLLAANLANTLSGYSRVLDEFCYNQDVWQYFSHTYTYPDSSVPAYYEFIQPMFSRYVSLNPEIMKATMYTTNQTVVTNNSDIAYLMSGSYQDEILRKKYTADESPWHFAFDKTDGKDCLVIARVVSLYQQPVGVFCLHINRAHLSSLVSITGSSAGLHVIAPDGRILLTSNSSLWGLSIKETFMQDTSLLDTATVTDLSLDSEAYKMIAIPFQVGGNRATWHLIQTESMEQILLLAGVNQQWMLAVLSLAIVLMGVCSFLFSHSLTKRLDRIVAAISLVEQGNFNAPVSVSGYDEVATLAQSLSRMTERLHTLVDENAHIQMQQRELAIANREATLNALQSQINPHFLFNTLEAVQYGIEAGLPQTSQVVSLLARNLRRITSWEQDCVSIGEELDFIREQLTIQQFRYGDKLRYTLDVPEALHSLQIPKMLLQPLVENAANHGVAMKRGSGLIEVSVRLDSGRLYLSVRDDGIGMDELTLLELHEVLSKPPGTATQYVGLKNVYDRLRLSYGDEGVFALESTAGLGTQIAISLPIPDVPIGGA